MDTHLHLFRQLILVGVCCSASADGTDPYAELSLQPLPEYVISTDGVTMTCITCTDKGQIFLSGRDGHIYELQYTTGSGWRKRCRKGEKREEAAAGLEAHYQKTVESFNIRLAERQEEHRQRMLADLQNGCESYRKELREEYAKKMQSAGRQVQREETRARGGVGELKA